MRTHRLLALCATAAILACDAQPTAPATRAEPAAPRASVATTATTYLVDTGQPDNSYGSGLFAVGSSPTCSPQPSCLASYQSLGGRFTLANDAAVEWVEVWMSVGTAGSLAVNVRADASGVPGAVLATTTYSVGTQALGWRTFTGIGAQLTAGTYWVTLEPVANAGFDGALWGHAPTPLADYAVINEGRGQWGAFGAIPFNPGYGIRVAGTPTAGPTPAQQITTLRVSVGSISLAKGLATSLDSKLRTALAAIDASNPTLACSSMQDFIQQVRAQSGKAVSASTAAAFVSSASTVRSDLGC